MKTYVAVYVGSLFLALATTPIVIWLARRLKAFDRPGIRTVHARPIPRIGGVAIFLSAMCLIVCILFLDNRVGEVFRRTQLQMLMLLCCATLVFFVGLADDLRGLTARWKFLAEIAAASVLFIVGVRITSIGMTSEFMLHLGWLSFPVTLLWIVGITNAVNLSDGLDGLAAGISAIACGTIAIIALHSSNVIMAVFTLALLGSLTGFLFFNFNPARIFMGDCGSLFVGFTIAAASVMCASKSTALMGLALPVLALGVPIFDTLFSMLRRFLERRSVFAPDRGHLHHRLLDLGLTQRHVVLSIYAVTLVCAGLGMFMMLSRDVTGPIVFICVLVLLLLVFRVVGAVRLHETIARLRDKYAGFQHRRQERAEFEDVQLRLRRVGNFDDWWSAACEAAQRMDFAWLSLKTKDEHGMVQTEVWRSARRGEAHRSLADVQPTLSDVVVMHVPIGNHCQTKPMEFEIAIFINGSFESVGRRATLFSRLIDEHRVMSSV